ncbi:hypothetical protein EIB71_05245 [Kaistella daneshvariae]|uniref:Uncharacterized protein n=1 Tax=Kaistella daneshvariae TaxID=2487074 RepID=A0A3N0WSI7_9FLAO|nr:hypothetical protein [Kaistella daneshvariae]AZI67105.1 hypothetical protein EIB71_05245 [Kaistella daneshvariae]ROI08002.1 hypothetical protein EGI11_10085 [Kaistella daneshvariae]
MNKNIFKNWSLSRVLYFCAGVFFVLIAVNDRVWWMIPFGVYFAVMAIFKFGCAGGACEIPSEKEVK